MPAVTAGLCLFLAAAHAHAAGPAPSHPRGPAEARTTVNFDFAWRYTRGGVAPPSAADPPESQTGFDDSAWALVDAPHDMGRDHELSCIKSGVGAAAAFAAAPPPAPPPCLRGGMAGGDTHVANMTVRQALAYCEQNNTSAGFTAAGQWPNVCSDAVFEMHFKDRFVCVWRSCFLLSGTGRGGWWWAAGRAVIAVVLPCFYFCLQGQVGGGHGGWACWRLVWCPRPLGLPLQCRQLTARPAAPWH